MKKVTPSTYLKVKVNPTAKYVTIRLRTKDGEISTAFWWEDNNQKLPDKSEMKDKEITVRGVEYVKENEYPI